MKGKVEAPQFFFICGPWKLRLETNLVLRLWRSEARGRVLENIVGMPVGSLMILCAKSATLSLKMLSNLRISNKLY